MLLYRTVRYFFFLMFVSFIVLFFVPRHFIPGLSSVYEVIENMYYSIPKYFNTNQQNMGNNIIENAEKKILSVPKQDIQNFIEDISSDFALDLAIDRNFDDLNYLISAYLMHNSSFEDIILYFNNEIIYKQNQQVSLSPIVFKQKRNIRRGIVTIEFIFKNELLSEFIKKNHDSLILNYRSQMFYTPNNSDIYTNTTLYLNKEDGRYDFNNRYYLYKKTVLQGLEFPISIFYIEKKQFSVGNIFQFLYLLLIPMIWILFVFIDNQIIKYIQQRRFHQEHQESLKIHDKNEEDSLDWLEEFVREEDEVSKK